MNHGCTIMTQKPSSSFCNGRRRPLRNQNKCTKFAATSNQCWSFFLTFEELCLRSLLHLVWMSKGIFTARFWDDWGKMWSANGLRCGRMETGCCTMTMFLHTPRSLWGNSWQKITWPLFPTLPSHLTWHPASSLCSLKWNSGGKGGISYPFKRCNQNCNRY